MLHIRKHALSLLRSPPPPLTTTIFTLHRLLSSSSSTTTTTTPQSNFAVEDHLIATCHLTPSQALKASKSLSHLKSPSNPDAVLAFPDASLRMNTGLLGSHLEKVAKPNIAILEECGLSVCDIARLFVYASRMLNMNPKVVQDIVARVDELGVPRSSPLFGRVLVKVSFLSREMFDAKVGLLEKLGMSRADVSVAVSKQPKVLTMSEDRIKGHIEFLTEEVGLDAPKIASKPTLLTYSLERRLLPRFYLIKVLRSKKLVFLKWNFYSLAILAEWKFQSWFVDRYKRRVPYLIEAYSKACAGEVPMLDALQEAEIKAGDTYSSIVQRKSKSKLFHGKKRGKTKV